MFNDAIKRTQSIGNVSFIIVNSVTTKVERTWTERLLSMTPFTKHRFIHSELIEDGTFLVGKVDGKSISYCNQKTFNALAEKIKNDKKDWSNDLQ